jgi:hypothetical protein
MQNSLSKPSDLQRTNVIYEFSCPIEGCKLLRNVKYVGMTTTTLSRRLTMHLSSGALKTHMKDEHNITLTRQILFENTKILKQFQDPSRLAIYEALLVRENNHASTSRTRDAHGPSSSSVEESIDFQPLFVPVHSSVFPYDVYFNLIVSRILTFMSSG